MEDNNSGLNEPQSMFQQQINLKPFGESVNRIRNEFSKVIIGQQDLLDLMITCIIAEGHILLEGVPGIAKTLSAKTIAQTIDAGFSRIQFTPDMMPADILGTSVFNMKSSEFVFKKGPIFSNVILIDEINRAPAKTQAALFEVMEERQISFEGTRYEMEDPFLVVATQNPIEQEGTYKLPEAQLDRFLMKIILPYPTQQEELQILSRFKNQLGSPDLEHINPVMDAAKIASCQELLTQFKLETQILDYITKIVHATRNHSKIYLGASPRASLALLQTSKVTAAMAGREFITPDDIQFVAPHVLNHRLILTPDAEMEGTSPFDLVEEILKTVEVPR